MTGRRLTTRKAGAGAAVGPPSRMTPIATAAQRLVENLTLDRHGRRRRSVRRMWSTDNLPMPRAFFRGPRWKRLCEVQEMPIAEVAPESAKYHRPGRKLLVFTFEAEVRALVCEPLRDGVVAEWTDPRERFGQPVAAMSVRSRRRRAM